MRAQEVKLGFDCTLSSAFLQFVPRVDEVENVTVSYDSRRLQNSILIETSKKLLISRLLFLIVDRK